MIEYDSRMTDGFCLCPCLLSSSIVSFVVFGCPSVLLSPGSELRAPVSGLWAWSKNATHEFECCCYLSGTWPCISHFRMGINFPLFILALCTGICANMCIVSNFMKYFQQQKLIPYRFVNKTWCPKRGLVFTFYSPWKLGFRSYFLYFFFYFFRRIYQRTLINVQWTLLVKMSLVRNNILLHTFLGLCC